MKNKLYNFISHALFVFVKHRDENGILFFSKKMTDEFDKEKFSGLINYFFKFYAEELEEEDFLFFQTVTETFIENAQKTLQKENEEVTLKKIKKTVNFLEKIGWRLGVDYSFKNGKLFMSRKNEKKLREIMKNNAQGSI